MSCVKINLSEFPDSFYVILNPLKREEIFKKAKREAGSEKKLAKKLNVHKLKIWKWKCGKRTIQLKNLKEICKTAKIDVDEIQNYVIGLKGDTYCRNALNINLPFVVDEKWAYFLELLRTDGHIGKNLKYVEFSNTDKQIFKNFINFVKSLGIENKALKIVPWNENGIFVKVSNRTFAVILHYLFEIPKGDKGGIIYIPSIIKNSDRLIIARAIRGAFDGDGYAVRRLKRVVLSCKSKQYVAGLVELFNRLGIYAEFYGPDKKKKYHCILMRRKEIKKFAKLIGFSHAERKKRLNKIINSFSKMEFYYPNEAKKKILDIVLRYGSIDRFKLAKLLNRSPDAIWFHLKNLVKGNKITFIKSGKRYMYLTGDKK